MTLTPLAAKVSWRPDGPRCGHRRLGGPHTPRIRRLTASAPRPSPRCGRSPALHEDGDCVAVGHAFHLPGWHDLIGAGAASDIAWNRQSSACASGLVTDGSGSQLHIASLTAQPGTDLLYAERRAAGSGADRVGSRGAWPPPRPTRGTASRECQASHPGRSNRCASSRAASFWDIPLCAPSAF
jgi:hypothetical protein